MHPADQAAALQIIDILDQGSKMKQGLLRDAALIQASSPRQGFLDQRHFCTKMGSGDRSLVTGRTATDNDEVKIHQETLINRQLSKGLSVNTGQNGAK